MAAASARRVTRRTPASPAHAHSGAVPPSLGGLTRLQWLALDGNRLGGPLPAFLGALPELRGAHLAGNSFAGPLPPAWCGNNASYTVEGNANLCGARGRRCGACGRRCGGPARSPVLARPGAG